MTNEGYIRIDEAAKYLGVSPKTLRNYALVDKTITYYRPGKKLLFFKKSDLDDYVKSGQGIANESN